MMDVEMVGLTEIAQRAGVQKPVVAMWRTRHPDFPAPAFTLATGPIWYWHVVKAWLDKTGRKSDCNWTREQVTRDNRSKHPPKDQ